MISSAGASPARISPSPVAVQASLALALDSSSSCPPGSRATPALASAGKRPWPPLQQRGAGLRRRPRCPGRRRVRRGLASAGRAVVRSPPAAPRVFLVGYLGAPCPPAVLFEPEGVRGHLEAGGRSGGGTCLRPLQARRWSASKLGSRAETTSGHLRSLPPRLAPAAGRGPRRLRGRAGAAGVRLRLAAGGRQPAHGHRSGAVVGGSSRGLHGQPIDDPPRRGGLLPPRRRARAHWRGRHAFCRR